MAAGKGSAEGSRRGTPSTGSAVRSGRAQRNAKEVRVLDAVETEALLDAAATTRWKAGLGLMGLAGLRLGEMRAVTWGDVGELSIRVSRSATPEGEMKTPKTRAGVRDVPLSPTLRRLLAEWRLESHRSQDEHLVVGTWSGKSVSRVRGEEGAGGGGEGGEAGRRGPALVPLAPPLIRKPARARRAERDDARADPRSHRCSFTLRTYCSDQRSVEDVAADVLRASAV